MLALARRLHERQVVRFALVGAVNTGVYYTLYLLLLTALPYGASWALATTGAMLVSYLLTSLYTFRRRPTWRTFLLFPLPNLANYAITGLSIALLVERLGVPAWLAPVPAAAVAIPTTYVLMTLVFHHPRAGGADAPDARSGAAAVVANDEPPRRR